MRELHEKIIKFMIKLQGGSQNNVQNAHYPCRAEAHHHTLYPVAFCSPHGLLGPFKFLFGDSGCRAVTGYLSCPIVRVGFQAATSAIKASIFAVIRSNIKFLSWSISKEPTLSASIEGSEEWSRCLGLEVVSAIAKVLRDCVRRRVFKARLRAN